MGKKRNRSSSSDSGHYHSSHLKRRIKQVEEKLDKALFSRSRPRKSRAKSGKASNSRSQDENFVRSPRDSTNRYSRVRSSRSSARDSVALTTASSSTQHSTDVHRERSPRGSSRTSEYSDWENSNGRVSPNSFNEIVNTEPPISENTTGDVLIIENDEMLDEETLKYLGENPKQQMEAFTIHKSIAERWVQILRNGLDKDVRDQLLTKHVVPDNLKELKAPAVNADVTPILPALTAKKDKYQESEQNQLGVGLAILGIALDLAFKENNRSAMLPLLWDSAKMLADLHYQLSMARRAHITPILNKAAKEVAATTLVDSTLFGTDFGERCKVAKGFEKASKDLVPLQQKQASFKKPRVGAYPTIPSRNYSLNRRGPSRPMREAGRYGPSPLKKRYTPMSTPTKK